VTKKAIDVPQSPEQARQLIEAYLAGHDDRILSEAIAALKTQDDEGDFAVMSGSGNEASAFVKALHLLKAAGLITPDESIAFIRRS